MSREETRKYPCSFFMENENLIILVPRILHSSIKYISFMEMVRGVLEANSDRSIERSDMVSLWNAILHVIYHFESSATLEQKAHEVCKCRP